MYREYSQTVLWWWWWWWGGLQHTAVTLSLVGYVHVPVVDHSYLCANAVLTHARLLLEDSQLSLRRAAKHLHCFQMQAAQYEVRVIRPSRCSCQVSLLFPHSHTQQMRSPAQTVAMAISLSRTDLWPATVVRWSILRVIMRISEDNQQTGTIMGLGLQTQ